MNFIGYLRTQDGNIVSSIVVVFVITFIYFLARMFLKKARVNNVMSAAELSSVLNIARLIYLAIIAAVALVCFLNAATMLFSNRMPRSDIDGSGVYRQMNSN